MSLNIDEIKALIPHRYPFLLVDRVDELEVGKRAVGIKNVSANEEYFNGHFPDYPVMPGVLQLEALAQLVGCCLMAGDSPFKGKLAFYAGVDGARFKRQVRPGDTLTLEVEVLSVRRNICKAKGIAKVGDEVACEAEMMFAIGK